MSTASVVSRTFLRGLAIILPVLAACYVLKWVIEDSEGLMKSLLLRVIPESYYLPGLGIITFVVFTFFFGFLMYPWITRRMLEFLDRILRRIPIFSSVYSPVKDLMNLLGGEMSDQLGEVVMIKVPGTEMETLGFVTRRDNAGLPAGVIPEGYVSVFVQWSYQIGGYCFIVPEDSLRSVDLTVEQGLRWSLTAGLSTAESI